MEHDIYYSIPDEWTSGRAGGRACGRADGRAGGGTGGRMDGRSGGMVGRKDSNDIVADRGETWLWKFDGVTLR